MHCAGDRLVEEVPGVPGEEIEVGDDGGGGRILQIAIEGYGRVP